MINFVITSTSASGKTTLVDYLLKSIPSLYQLKTCTTRKIRKEETGNEYHFLTRETFLNLIASDELIEYSIVYENYYGITKQEILNNKNKNSIIILDVQGAIKFKKIFPDSVLIFIMPPELNEIENRLLSRNTSSHDVFVRMNTIKNEMEYINKFNFKIPYGNLDYMKSNLVDLISVCIKYTT